MSEQLFKIHSVQSVIDAQGITFTYEELFTGENGSLAKDAMKPLKCGSCKLAEVRAVPATPNRRAYIALINSEISGHTAECEYDFTNRATKLYSGTSYTRAEEGKYILDLFPTAKALEQHLADRSEPQHVTEDYRHVVTAQATRNKALNAYLRTIKDILKLLQDFDNTKEITRNFAAFDKATSTTYEWEQIYYDLSDTDRIAALRKFLVQCHKDNNVPPPLIVAGTVRTIWSHQTTQYLLTTSTNEKKQGLRAFIWPPYGQQAPSQLLQGDRILSFGKWKIYCDGNNKLIKLPSGANSVSFTWEDHSQLTKNN